MLLSAAIAPAQLVVTVGVPKVTGQKVIVQLKLKNSLTNDVISARAVCFLLDEQGKMVNQSTKWVIGQNKARLAVGATNEFNFVITNPQPFTTTNLTAKVSFTRMVLVDGKLAKVQRDVAVTAVTK